MWAGRHKTRPETTEIKEMMSRRRVLCLPGPFLCHHFVTLVHLLTLVVVHSCVSWGRKEPRDTRDDPSPLHGPRLLYASLIPLARYAVMWEVSEMSRTTSLHPVLSLSSLVARREGEGWTKRDRTRPQGEEWCGAGLCSLLSLVSLPLLFVTRDEWT